MQPIRSSTTTERIIRALLLMVLVNGFAVAYLWDGYVGYARENVRVLVNSLGLPPDSRPQIDPHLTRTEGRRLAEGLGRGVPLGELISSLGEPALRRVDDLYYLGPGGHLRIQAPNGRTVAAEWREGLHGESDIKWQRWIGYVLAVVGVIAIAHFVRVVTTRVVLTDEGLQIGRKPVIPLEAITALSPAQPGPSDPVTIEYAIEGGIRAVWLDSYRVKKLPAIVAALRERRGFCARESGGERAAAEGGSVGGNGE